MRPTPEQAAGESLSRLVDRLRSMALPRLSRPTEALAGQSLAAAGYELARWCVAAEAGVQGRTADRPPAARTLPRLADLSTGDQLWVVGYELLMALAEVPDGDEVWLEGRRVPPVVMLDAFVNHVTTLRAVV
jgi:hypothetical protein